jgi:uncharacterized membrane protein
MKICFCRILLAVAIAVIALVWWPAGWAKFVIAIAAVLLAVAGFSPATCCCKEQKKPAEPETSSTS